MMSLSDPGRMLRVTRYFWIHFAFSIVIASVVTWGAGVRYDLDFATKNKCRKPRAQAPGRFETTLTS